MMMSNFCFHVYVHFQISVMAIVTRTTTRDNETTKKANVREKRQKWERRATHRERLDMKWSNEGERR